ncbi:AP-4-A phosphorylase [Ruminiclostridium hungatei]|uniref:AP-4-A phosphorylase n=1 Tax=Ruminiclostridium hungatei TaxID=48256 RepID=A0A1V4SR76_RUMHU|nr:AP-4-A phosphorylase [Ruminiclostridium hungatei]
MSCIFCDYINDKNYLMENELAVAIYDKFPVNKGHVLIIPKRHYASYFDATQDEIIAFNDLTKKVKALLDSNLKPDGYNIGINIGEAAGQTIFHLHVHVIPRYYGDVDNPRGGIRKLKKPLVEYDG